ncbi:alpha/beta fold hydrolase [Curvibacter sp. RS43]|uniref:Alpha/beta fold hydrolase n=1 Tax=Curvibacter microcysteis TaxID=3026419 RepID=A0ABT5MAZ4_9BURK|nr:MULTISPECIES: alpha/beta fold hydrolase [unclassified Curvibacter]MDD0811271.1 alpha/beta fold hydrolase [Curvibacter sp. RS43]MDD0813758.1 alpha/beta fold hydrolase [Curvibacter sp. HBC28]
MNAQTLKFDLQGPAGRIEGLRDAAALSEGETRRGVAVIAHPHPLFGGTMDNKVVQTLARAFVQSGWDAVRFNFRGVGGSAGAWDEGRGEVDDFLAVLSEQAAEGPIAIAGFSFGAYVASHALQAQWAAREVQRVVLVGTAASRFQVAALPEAAHEHTLVLHGEQDDTVPLSAVLDWARPQALPVTVVPGVGHFFHGQLPLLKNCVLRHLRP